jgi:Outer membrane protein beta-barrel domain
LPLKLAYQAPTNTQTSLFVNAGPYIAYGIGGKETLREKTRPATVRNDEKFVVNTFEKAQRRRGDYGLKRLDYGASFGLGAIYKKYILSGGYEIGLADIGESYGSSGPVQPAYEYKNRNLYITIGYRL